MNIIVINIFDNNILISFLCLTLTKIFLTGKSCIDNTYAKKVCKGVGAKKGRCARKQYCVQNKSQVKTK